MKGSSGPDGQVLAFLEDHPLFRGLAKSAVRTLAAASRFRQVARGATVFWQSDPSDAAYLVRFGRISLVLNSPDGRELIIEEMRAGDLFGELGLLTRKPHSAGAVARSNSELLVMPRDAFLHIVDQEAQLARLVLDLTATRLQMSVSREVALAFMNAHARLARYLLALEERERDRGYVTASQEDLARGTGLIRQTVAKALGVWRREGWLLTGRGRILILNRRALEEVERGAVDLTPLSPR